MSDAVGGNQALALDVLRQLVDHGVREVCVCPGARNSPLSALSLETKGLRKLFFFEERSAAFFALGRIKATGRPVAVVTTSGTAAGELLPATMEAHYTGLPLLLLTADRPRRFRGTGAPQTAEQPGIFGVYAESSYDVARAGELRLEWSRSRPLHVNVCFEEPLLDSSVPPETLHEWTQRTFPVSILPEKKCAEDIRIKVRSALSEFLSRAAHPLVLVGSLEPEDRPAVAAFLAALGAPVHLEAQSGLREHPALSPLRLQASDGLLARAARTGYPIDGALRLGGVPTLRLWRDLEILGGKIPVLSISDVPFAGLSWAEVHTGPLRTLLPKNDAPPLQKGAEHLLAEDRVIAGKIEELYREEPRSEPAIFRALSRAIPRESRVYLGNSLPIREWDFAATHENRGFQVAASRGLNGIDGQVSTFLGFAEAAHSNWAILGDLTTLYDLPGPWILSQLPDIRAQIVVVNNGGGRIFSRMFPHAEFQNTHEIEFSGWARLWKIAYERWTEVPAELRADTNRIIEIVPDNEATARFWKKAEGLLKS